MSNILILEDNMSFANVLSIIAKKMGHSVVHYISPFEAIKNSADIKNADLIISDFEMSPGTTIDLLKYMQENNLTNEVILNSGYANALEEIEKAGFSGFISGQMDKYASVSEIKNDIEKFLGN